MPPTPQSVQIAGQKQNQQQYDPSKGPPVQNAASLHTPPPQLPGRVSQGAVPMAGLPMTLSQQPQLLDNVSQAGAQLQAQVKVHAAGQLLAPVNPHAQLQAQLQQQQMQPSLHLHIQAQQQAQVMIQSGQAVSSLESINMLLLLQIFFLQMFKLKFCLAPLRRWRWAAQLQRPLSRYRGLRATPCLCPRCLPSSPPPTLLHPHTLLVLPAHRPSQSTPAPSPN